MKTSSKMSTGVHKKTRVFVTDGTHATIICAGSLNEKLSKTPKGPITHAHVSDLYFDEENKSGIYPIENVFYCEMEI